MSLIKSIKKIGDVTNKATPDVVDTVLIDPREWRSQMSDMFLPGGAGMMKSFQYSGLESSLKAYTKCPPLTAIINRKAQAHINGKTWILNTRGKEATSEQAIKLRKLFAKPNALQSWKQFEAQQKIYMQLFGYSLVLPIIPAGFEKYGNIEASSLWNIPPYMLDIEETKKLFYQSDLQGIIKSIKLCYKGETSFINVKDVYFFKDFTPSFNSFILPESRICSLEMPINNIMGAFESRNVLINYRGALGIISSESDKNGYIPIKDDDKTDLQKDFLRYGLKGQQWKFIITSAAVKWQQIGVPTKDLMLFEEVKDSTLSLCDAFGYPPHLLGLIDPTFNNQNAADKGLYQNTIIPEADSIYEEWNNLFKTSEFNIKIDKDFSHIAVLQEDRKTLAEARSVLNTALEKEWRNGMITLNFWLEKNGEDPLTDERGKMYFPEYVALYGDPMKGVQQASNNNSDNNNPPANGN